MVIFVKDNFEVVNDLSDLQDAIIDNLGHDVWQFINNGSSDELAETKRVLEIREEEIRGYDIDVTSLRDTCVDTMEKLEILEDEIRDAKRINRKELLVLIEQMKKSITNTEGY